MRSRGGTRSWLGFPISDSADSRTSRDEPRWTIQEFEGGTVFWTEKYRSVAVPRATMEYLSQYDGLREQLGRPIEQEIALASADDRRMQLFEHGLVTAHNGTVEVWLRPEAYLRAAPLPEPGEDLQRISLVALNFSPKTVAREEPIFLEYEIQALPGALSPVILGASLVAEKGDDYFDKASDLQVDLILGRASYRRPLVVPASTTRRQIPPDRSSLVPPRERRAETGPDRSRLRGNCHRRINRVTCGLIHASAVLLRTVTIPCSKHRTRTVLSSVKVLSRATGKPSCYSRSSRHETGP